MSVNQLPIENYYKPRNYLASLANGALSKLKYYNFKNNSLKIMITKSNTKAFLKRLLYF